MYVKQRRRTLVQISSAINFYSGEMMALEWADVNLAKRQLTVARSEWKGHVTATKGGRVRHLPLTVRLAAALQEARHLKGARVLCDRHGASLTQKEVQVTMRRVARKAQGEARRPHPAAHLLFSSGHERSPARAIQELAGHQDLASTQRYMHLSPAALDAAIRLLDRPRPLTGRGEIVEAAGNQG
jgi:integrase